MTQVREQNANKVVDTTNINENQIQQPILQNANWLNMEAIAEEQERIHKSKMHRTEETRNTSAGNGQTESEINTTIPYVGIFVQRENNLQTDEIILTQQQPSVAVNNAPSKRSLAQRARREKEKQMQLMDPTTNIMDTSTQQYSRCQEAENEANAPHASLMNDISNHWNTLENARENSEDCGVAPYEILGIDETTNTATRLRNRIFETGESSRVPID
ncbi:hypothetical protein GIB67_035474, partial [Kingdonia uniflora]